VHRDRLFLRHHTILLSRKKRSFPDSQDRDLPRVIRIPNGIGLGLDPFLIILDCVAVPQGALPPPRLLRSFQQAMANPPNSIHDLNQEISTLLDVFPVNDLSLSEDVREPIEEIEIVHR
ncbi:unnamed protein product, partial [Brassica oleracea]